MNNFGFKLRELRRDNDLTQDQLKDILNEKYGRSISKSMLSKWENGREEPSRFSDVVAISEYFDVTTDYLIGLSDSKFDTVQKIDFKKVRILGTIAAGIPISSQEDILGYEYIDPNEDVHFCLKVKGDSMINARIFNNDIVYVRQQDDVENGEIAAIQIDGEEATLKRFYREHGKIRLHSENPTIPDMIFTAKDRKQIKILGKILYVKFEAR